MVVWAVWSAFLGGCVDPRISLDEFLAMQESKAQVPAEAPPVPAPGTHALDAYLAEYTIGAGDALNVVLTGLVIDEPMMSNAFRVRVNPSGEIDLPLVGAVKVSGLDESGAERAIKRAYVPAIVRHLTLNVLVSDYRWTNVVVTGAVSQPGLIPLRRSERNLLYAVLGAGGISSGASGRVTLRRVRRPHVQETFDLLDPTQVEAALSIDPLENGDIVMVGPAQPNTVFVGGLVNRPAPQMYPPGVDMTVLQVLAAAGGVREDVYPREGTLIRRMADGTDVHVKLNFSRIKRGQDPNFTLAAGDVLWVPETVGTKILDFFNRNLYFRGGVSINYNASGTEFLNSNSRGVALRGVGGSLEDQFDPFGFLNQNAAINALANVPRAR